LQSFAKELLRQFKIKGSFDHSATHPNGPNQPLNNSCRSLSWDPLRKIDHY
jgi:hypothetical protein